MVLIGILPLLPFFLVGISGFPNFFVPGPILDWSLLGRLFGSPFQVPIRAFFGVFPQIRSGYPFLPFQTSGGEVPGEVIFPFSLNGLAFNYPPFVAWVPRNWTSLKGGVSFGINQGTFLPRLPFNSFRGEQCPGPERGSKNTGYNLGEFFPPSVFLLL